MIRKGAWSTCQFSYGTFDQSTRGGFDPGTHAYVPKSVTPSARRKSSSSRAWPVHSAGRLLPTERRGNPPTSPPPSISYRASFLHKKKKHHVSSRQNTLCARP